MKYRITEKMNLLNNKMAYIVEVLSRLTKSWYMCYYEDERNDCHPAIFDKKDEALAFAKNGGAIVAERIVWEGEDDE